MARGMHNGWIHI